MLGGIYLTSLYTLVINTFTVFNLLMRRIRMLGYFSAPGHTRRAIKKNKYIFALTCKTSRSRTQDTWRKSARLELFQRKYSSEDDSERESKA